MHSLNSKEFQFSSEKFTQIGATTPVSSQVKHGNFGKWSVKRLFGSLILAFSVSHLFILSVLAENEIINSFYRNGFSDLKKGEKK